MEVTASTSCHSLYPPTPSPALSLYRLLADQGAPPVTLLPRQVEHRFTKANIDGVSCRRGQETKKKVAHGFTCHTMIANPADGSRAIFAGCSDGPIVAWRQQHECRLDSKMTMFFGHQGAVCSLFFGEECGAHGLLFSGGADRAIKVWDPHVRDPTNACVQTLTGHGGTITCLAYGGGTLFSASNDRTVRLWRPDPGRVLLLYPWFSVVQTIGAFPAWANALAIRVGEATALYIGDASGTLSVYEPSSAHSASASHRNPSAQADDGDGRRGRATGNALGAPHAALSMEFDLRRRQHRVHALGITKLLLVPEQNFVVTLSYDNNMRVFDAMNGAAFLTIENEHRCRYTDMAWNSVHQELFLVDEMGFLYIWNVYTEKCLKKQRLRDVGLGSSGAGAPSRDRSGFESAPGGRNGFPGKSRAGSRQRSALTSVSVWAGGDRFSVTSFSSVDQWVISRDLNFRELKGHSGPVISLVSIDPRQGEIAPDSVVDDHSIFSASLDNTVRCWDAYDMSCLYVLRETVSEISCLVQLSNCNLLVTGNDDGSIRWWNPDSGSAITLKHHKNTVSCLAVAQMKRNEYLISASYAGTVGVWDITRRRAVRPRLEYMFQAHGGVECDGEDSKLLEKLGIGPRLMAAPGGFFSKREIFCVCFNSATVDVSLPGPASESAEIAISGDYPSGALLSGGDGKGPRPHTFLTGGNDATIRIWSLENYAMLSTLDGHGDAITCLALDANFLFSGSEDRSIRIWNMADICEPYELCVLDAHSESVRDIMILPMHGHLVSCSFDGSIKVWDYGFSQEAEKAGHTLKEFRHVPPRPPRGW